MFWISPSPNTGFSLWSLLPYTSIPLILRPHGIFNPAIISWSTCHHMSSPDSMFHYYNHSFTDIISPVLLSSSVILNWRKTQCWLKATFFQLIPTESGQRKSAQLDDLSPLSHFSEPSAVCHSYHIPLVNSLPHSEMSNSHLPLSSQVAHPLPIPAVSWHLAFYFTEKPEIIKRELAYGPYAFLTSSCLDSFFPSFYVAFHSSFSLGVECRPLLRKATLPISHVHCPEFRTVPYEWPPRPQDHLACFSEFQLRIPSLENPTGPA